jgi:hypothetical protein
MFIAQIVAISNVARTKYSVINITRTNANRLEAAGTNVVETNVARINAV